MRIVKLKIFPVPVRLHSGYGKLIFVIISPCFAIFKNVVHSLKPGETQKIPIEFVFAILSSRIKKPWPCQTPTICVFFSVRFSLDFLYTIHIYWMYVVCFRWMLSLLLSDEYQ